MLLYERFPRGTGLFAMASWYEQRLPVEDFDPAPISHSVLGSVHPVFRRGTRCNPGSGPFKIPPTYFVKSLRAIRVRTSPLDPSLHEDAATFQWLYQRNESCHPNVLSISGVCRIPDGGFGVVFPCTGLKSLREFLHEEPGLDRVQLSLQISHGLAHIHQVGVVHGRLRAANVLVSLTGNAILSDPCLLEMGGTGFTEQYLKENVGWLAPEIVRGKPLSQASDSYSLGMVILEVISGMAPYTKLSEVELWDTVLAGQPPIPARPIGVIPNDQYGNRLWHFLYSCWDCDPVNRPSAALASDFMSGAWI
ncbi:Dual specificity protein kinase shkD OS=Dictyostelium discoideum GN=shkD PE=3 SV=1 [Rhizoctonia solani AG-1 IB]|uniref:Dual specificity protein kinase shkD n=1 Tax=Thanatephorus cucumeris (strain AG1-IB / isolate 7/3/14) TaxID=1108050 RepID=A0A0B7G115_THACB|nr:Dual specificity protein kinase shkD OS=Dictyostelium discoideum GN=shkD PE=3 SV=1 [Rhizoctonia solani AG-1 IB]